MRQRIVSECEQDKGSGYVVFDCCDHSLLNIIRSPVEIVTPQNLTWTLNTSSITKKAQHHLYFLSEENAFPPSSRYILHYRGTIESTLCSCIAAWYGNYSISDCKTLQDIVRTVEKIIGVSLPSVADIYSSAKPPALWMIPHTPPISSSPSFHLAKGSIAYRPSLPGWETVFSLRLSDF